MRKQVVIPSKECVDIHSIIDELTHIVYGQSEKNTYGRGANVRVRDVEKLEIIINVPRKIWNVVPQLRQKGGDRYRIKEFVDPRTDLKTIINHVNQNCPGSVKLLIDGREKKDEKKNEKKD